VLQVDIDSLLASNQQPRLQMDDTRLDELAHSIRNNGVIQPILVRRTDDGYRIIAGERRWRAARKAGLATVPVIVREQIRGGDKEILELALVENIQRENLNAIEEAIAYQRLIDEHSLTQEEIAAAVGKDRSTVANFLRLLRLDPTVRAQVASGTLSMGHARALLAIAQPEAQRAVAAEVVEKGLSVRQTEARARRLGSQPAARPRQAAVENDVHTRAAEERLRFALGTRVRIVRKSEGGVIEVDFGSEDELNRLYEQLVGSSAS
jgi:ParB family chromosome partitioning protein